MQKTLNVKTQKTRGRKGGFTFVELLVVIAVAAMLTALLIPAMAKSGTGSAAIQCMSNLRQLTAAWQMYADNYHGLFVSSWVRGNENYSGGSDNTNSALMINQSLLGPYIKNASLLKCPSDMSLSYGTHGLPRVRSYAMSVAVGTGFAADQFLPAPPYQAYLFQSNLGSPSPDKLFLLLEQNPDSIDDALFLFQMPTSAAANRWVDCPAKYHDNACNFSFTDGHAELHKWQMPQSIPDVTYTNIVLPSVASNSDVWWVGNHTSAKADGTANPFPATD